MIKLDDFLTKKKEPTQVLDLSKVRIESEEEFKKYFDKIPECKVKPEKILPDSVKVKDRDFTFVLGKKEEKQGREYNYPDPTPTDMRGAKLEDLYPVNIDWKMLTTLRPKTKVEEDMFSRLVQLGKLDLKHQQAVQREKPTNWIRKTKNPKSSIIEMKILSCRECGEDFCDSSMCSKLMYDSFFRPQASASTPTPNLLFAAESGEFKRNKKKRKKKKRKKKTKEKKKVRKQNSNKIIKKKLGKNSIFNRPVSRGCNRDHSRRTGESVEKPRVRALSSTRSFSTERMRTRINFFERRSKSAPKIHFKRDVMDTKPKRYIYTSDSGPSQSDYSTQSDSESLGSRGKFFSPKLQLSGRRKRLSDRVGFSRKNRHGSSVEQQRLQFVRNCTLYKGYLTHHSNASLLDSQDDDDDDDNDDSSSESSTSPQTRFSSISPKKLSKSFSPTKYPSTIQIQFEQDYETSGLKFPDKIFLPNKIQSIRSKVKDVSNVKCRQLIKVVEGFSKIDLQFEEEHVKTAWTLPQKPRTGSCSHISRSRTSKLSKFSGPYLKAKGLFEKKKQA